jgi:hypothetical protein
MWTQETSNDGKVLHKTISRENTQNGLKVSILSCADHAFSLFDDNVKNESMYCLFDWNYGQQTLTISVTEPSKIVSSKHIVQLKLEKFDDYLNDKEDQQEQIQLWLHNHLTTSAEFLQYSLVASMMADGDLSRSVLL